MTIVWVLKDGTHDPRTDSLLGLELLWRKRQRSLSLLLRCLGDAKFFLVCLWPHLQPPTNRMQSQCSATSVEVPITLPETVGSLGANHGERSRRYAVISANNTHSPHKLEEVLPVMKIKVNGMDRLLSIADVNDNVKLIFWVPFANSRLFNVHLTLETMIESQFCVSVGCDGFRKSVSGRIDSSALSLFLLPSFSPSFRFSPSFLKL